MTFSSFARTVAIAVAVNLAVSTSLAQEPVSPDADFTVRDITRHLYTLGPGERADFSGHDLTYLDLSGLDFKGARLAQSDLYGADFTGADLTKSDLSKTRLDRAVLIQADLRFADLSGATILRPTIYRDMTDNLSDTPDFSGATMIGTRIQAKLSGAKFRGANLTRADLSPLESRPGEGTLVTLAHNTFKSCDFSGAKLVDANLTAGIFTFAQFNGADLSGADATEAEFVKADLRGVNFTNTNLRDADFSDANLAGAVGMLRARNLETAVHLDRAHGVPEAVLKRWRAAQRRPKE